jgi:hypothetical protein
MGLKRLKKENKIKTKKIIKKIKKIIFIKKNV